MAQVVYQLSAAQEKVLEQLVALLGEWGAENTRKTPSAPGREPMRSSSGFHPSPRQETPRVLMLDGERGSGKTSLLLTLVQAWYGEEPASDDKTNQKLKELSSKLRRHAFLPTVDFDPLPDGMPVYVWLLSAFVQVCERLAKQAPPRSDGAGNKPSLRRALQDLQQTALLGWTDETGDERAEDLMITRYQGMRSWERFRRQWCEFADELVDTLEQHELLGTQGMLVVPVDDLDMRLRLFRETLLALRQLTHPRICFLVCGESQQMRRALTWELAQRVAGDGRWVSREQLSAWESVGANSTSRWTGYPDELADRILEKQIPIDARFKLGLMDLVQVGQVKVRVHGEPMSIAGLLGFAPSEPEDETEASADTQTEEPASDDETSWLDLAKWPSGGRPMRATYRQVTNAVRDMARADESDKADRLGRFLRAFRVPGSPWSVERLPDGGFDAWEVQGSVEIDEVEPTESYLLVGDLRMAARRRFEYSLHEELGLEVDQLGVLLSALGTGPLTGTVSGSGVSSRWTYQFYGTHLGFAVPWLSAHAESEGNRGVPRPARGVRPSSGFTAIAWWLGQHDSMDLWEALGRWCRSAGEVEGGLDSSQIDALAALLGPESGLPVWARALVLVWLDNQSVPLMKLVPAVRRVRLDRFTMISSAWRRERAGAYPFEDGTSPVDATDVVIEALGVGSRGRNQLAALLPIQWRTTNGDAFELADILYSPPVPQGDYSTGQGGWSLLRALTWPPELGRLKHPTYGLPHRSHGSSDRARDQLSWMWKDWLLGVPSRWDARFAGHGSEVIAHMAEVASRARAVVSIQNGVPDASGVQVRPAGKLEPAGYGNIGVDTYRLRHWKCDALGEFHPNAIPYRNALVSMIGILQTFQGLEAFADLPDLVRVSEVTLGAPVLSTWWDYELLFASVRALGFWAETSGEFHRRDWLLISVVDAVAAIGLREYPFPDGRPRVSIPLSVEGAHRAGERLSNSLHKNNGVSEWLRLALRKVLPLLSPDIGVAWASRALVWSSTRNRDSQQALIDLGDRLDPAVRESLSQSRGFTDFIRDLSTVDVSNLPSSRLVIDWMLEHVLPVRDWQDMLVWVLNRWSTERLKELIQQGGEEVSVDRVTDQRPYKRTDNLADRLSASPETVKKWKAWVGRGGWDD